MSQIIDDPVVKPLNTLLGIAFDNCLLNSYEADKNTLGFHSDPIRDLQPGTGIAVTSLGSGHRITVRNKVDRTHPVDTDLLPGSVLDIDDAVQEIWLHAIKKQADATPSLRFTWREFVGQ